MYGFLNNLKYINTTSYIAIGYITIDFYLCEYGNILTQTLTLTIMFKFDKFVFL